MWVCDDIRSLDIEDDHYDYKEKLVFHTIWYDTDSSEEKKFLLNYYPRDNTLELIDTQLDRIFLKRTCLNGVHLQDMFIGNEIRVYGRQIKITDCADNRTLQFIAKSSEHTIAVIKPDALDKIGEILKIIEENEFRITKLKMCTLTRNQAEYFYDYLKDESFTLQLIDHLISGPIVAIELVGEYATRRWNKLIGPSSPSEARKTSPNSLRALYGKERVTNAIHGSLNEEMALEEAKFFFIQYHASPALKHKNATCCVIKPHAVKEGNLGRIVASIQNSGFSITAMQLFYLNDATANEFMQVYKGVVADYNALLLSFVDGPCVALEISNKESDWDVHGQFRHFCGPYDTDIARKIRPNSLRAKFGLDRYKNAVHCTDLHEDTFEELSYFFKLLNV
ncbi:nucleoside diphosphate kinase 7-like [Aethina tumida]|uniref:nucleoside diphosphate kinase 7-like n=1 Tax=Aethina tumida TaxID=116153 RepID=UPI00096AF7AF|nr:nucleoside diphosphate kinase 7-like [Aethina tumida]